MKRLAPYELAYNDFKEIGENVNQVIINYLSKNYFNQQQLIDFENFLIQFIEVFKNSDLLKVMKYVKFSSNINKAQKTIKKKKLTEAIAPNYRIKMKNEVSCFHYINLINDLTLYLDKTGGLEPETKIIEIVLALDDCGIGNPIGASRSNVLITHVRYSIVNRPHIKSFSLKHYRTLGDNAFLQDLHNKTQNYRDLGANNCRGCSLGRRQWKHFVSLVKRYTVVPPYPR
uniref:Uncharacterized protein n=1 Tax=Strongyloides papillosus TaxID=174720 RepID=A0A0N5C602_STREA